MFSFCSVFSSRRFVFLTSLENELRITIYYKLFGGCVQTNYKLQIRTIDYMAKRKQRIVSVRRAFGDDSSAFCGTFVQLRQPLVNAVHFAAFTYDVF